MTSIAEPVRFTNPSRDWCVIIANLWQLMATSRGIVQLTYGMGEHFDNDIALLAQHERCEYPDVPLILIGHSMGSFAAQQYVLGHSDEIAALILSRTAAIDLLEPALNPDQPMDLAAFNTPFAPARTKYDWLSRDLAQIDAYGADPRCGFGLDQEAAKARFASARSVADPVPGRPPRSLQREQPRGSNQQSHRVARPHNRPHDRPHNTEGLSTADD